MSDENYKRKNGKPVCEVPLLEVMNLSFSYDKVPILKDINFQIRDIPTHGQVVGILGPSGIGKTTLINIITGTIDEGYTGDVLIYDDVKNKVVSVHEGLVGKVTQNYWFFPFYTVMKNLTLAAAKKNNSSKAEQKDRVEDMLQRFGMIENKDKYRAQLSGGQKQRVAIMQQLLCSEHFIVLDEPFTSLDPNMKDDLANLLDEVADMDEFNTIIIVTHDIAQALACADTLLLFGRDRDTAGKIIPGAYIKKIYDLAAMGLAYQKDVMLTTQFSEVMCQLRSEFRQL